MKREYVVFVRKIGDINEGDINEIDTAILTRLASWFAEHCGEWVIQDERTVIDIKALRLEANKALDILPGLFSLGD